MITDPYESYTHLKRIINKSQDNYKEWKGLLECIEYEEKE